MIKKQQFLERFLFLIKKELEDFLPDETSLDEMINKSQEILENFIKN